MSSRSSRLVFDISDRTLPVYLTAKAKLVTIFSKAAIVAVEMWIKKYLGWAWTWHSFVNLSQTLNCLSVDQDQGSCIHHHHRRHLATCHWTVQTDLGQVGLDLVYFQLWKPIKLLWRTYSFSQTVYTFLQVAMTALNFKKNVLPQKKSKQVVVHS